MSLVCDFLDLLGPGSGATPGLSAKPVSTRYGGEALLSKLHVQETEMPTGKRRKYHKRSMFVPWWCGCEGGTAVAPPEVPDSHQLRHSACNVLRSLFIQNSYNMFRHA